MTDYTIPGPSRAPRDWTGLDSENLDRIARAQAAITGLLVVAVLLLAAALVLGIVGYNKVADRLDNLEDAAATVVVNTTPTP